MFEQLDDTIVAISSPPGNSVRGIVRLSGPEAWPLAEELFERRGSSFTAMGGYRRVEGRLRLGKRFISAEAYLFRAPASYTRQDSVELHLLGSPPLLAHLVESLIQAGARLAEPGEFTARAFFAGQLDLTEVEGVAQAIHARNDSQLRASQALLHGQLSRRTTVLRDRLAELLGLLEAEIDFAEEPIDFVEADQVTETLNDVEMQLGQLLNESPQLERIDVLPAVILVGPPNAGKSTLFNRLTGMDRAIRSTTAGTTRDLISAPISLAGGECLLYDSAGIFMAKASSAHSPDSQSIGLNPKTERLTRQAIKSADLILLVMAGDEQPGDVVEQYHWLPWPRTLVVLNKIDACPTDVTDAGLREPMKKRTAIPVSGLTGHNIDNLLDRLNDGLFDQGHGPNQERLALSQRQHAAIDQARQAVAVAKEHCRQQGLDGVELLALEVRRAMDELSLLTGQVTTEELLGQVFANFCIGK